MHKHSMLLFLRALLLCMFIHTHQIKAPQVAVLFSNNDPVQEKLLNLIACETESIKIAVFRLSDKIVANKLIEQKKAGVSIEIITDAGGLDTRINQILRLHEAGIPIYIYPPSKTRNQYTLMHHKFSLFAHNGRQREPIIWTGSYNFTTAASAHNQENVLIIYGDQLIYQKFLYEFEQLKKISQKL